MSSSICSEQVLWSAWPGVSDIENGGMSRSSRTVPTRARNLGYFE